MSPAHAAYLICVFLVGVINLMPVLGVLGPERIETLYGMPVDSPDMEILLRHRALTFGILGGFALCSLAIPGLRVAALTLCGISMFGFLLLAFSVGGYGQALGRVVVVDLVGLLVLAIAAVLGRMSSV